jgi:iron complex outermembrane receptor protein
LKIFSSIISYLGIFGFLTITSAKETTISDSTIQELDKVVVTATKTENKISTAPAAMSIVTKKDIARHSYNGVDEALKYEAGIYNKRSKGLAETMAGTVMRGFGGADQILVLLDGQPMNNGYVGRVQFNHVQIDDIDKIEVVRGPFSSLYGGNAMGGVVSIISKKPTSLEMKARSYYSGDGSYGVSASYGDTMHKKLSFRLGVGHKFSDGYISDDIVKSLGTKGRRGKNVNGVEEQLDRKGARTVLLGTLGNNGAKNWNVNGKLYYDFSDNHSIYLGVQNARYKYWRDYGMSNLRDSLGNIIDTGFVTYRLKDTTYYQRVGQNMFLDGAGQQATTYYNMGYDGLPGNKIKLKFRSGIAHMYENWYTSVGTSATRGNGDGKISSTPNMKGNAELTAQLFEIFPRQNILIGIGVDGAQAKAEEWKLKQWYDEDSKTDITYKTKGKSGSGAIFIQDEISVLKDISFFKTLSIYAGLRYDYWMTFDGSNWDLTNSKLNNSYDNQSKSSVSPKLAIVSTHAFNDLWSPSFRIAGGKAFRAPTIYDLYRTWISSTGWMYQGNPDLKPEQTWSVEGGMTNFFFKKRIQLGITGYYNRITDMIYTTAISDSLKLSKKTNAGLSTTRGIETNLVLAPLALWKAFANYTWNDSRIKENPVNPRSVGKKVTGIPEHVFSIGNTFTLRGISLTLDGRYVSKRYSLDDNSDTLSNVYGSRDEVMTWDAVVGYTINKRLSVNFKIDNIADKIVYDYYRMPGRVLTGEVRVEF